MSKRILLILTIVLVPVALHAQISSTIHSRVYDEQTGTYKGLKFHGGNPQILSQDYLYGIAEGDVSGHVLFNKYGVYTGVTNSLTDIWEPGGVYVFPTSAVTLDVSSTSATDSSASTGVTNIRIECLDASYNLVYVDASVNGITPKYTTAQTCLRVNSAWITAVGTSGMAVGDIDVRNSSTGAILTRIAATKSRARNTIYTVPLGKTLYITSTRMSCGVGNTTASGKFNYITLTNRATVNPQTGAKSTIFYPLIELGIINQAVVLPSEGPVVIPATADLRTTAIGDTALAVTCTVAYRGWIE